MQDPTDFEKADINQAKEYQKTQKVHSVDGSEVKVEGLMVSLDKLDIGSQFYFKYIIFLMVTFIIYFLILIPSLRHNYNQTTTLKFLDNVSKQFKFTIVNQQPLVIPYPIPPDAEKYMLLQPYYASSALISGPVETLQKQYVDKHISDSKTNLNNQMVPDLILCIVFVLSLVVLKKLQTMTYTKYKQKKITVRDYTIKVSAGRNSDVGPADIEKHFKQFGEIVEVGYSLYTNRRMFYAYKETKLDTQIRKEQKKQELGQQKDSKFIQSLCLEKQKNQDKRKQLGKQTPDTLKYNWFYVTFNEVATKNEVLHFYNNHNILPFLMNIFIKEETKQKLLVNNKVRVCVQDIDDPQNIYWENQDEGCNWVYKLIRFLILLVISVVTVIIFSAIYVSNKKNQMLNLQPQDHYYSILFMLGLYNPAIHKGKYELNQFCLQSGVALSEINDQHVCYTNLKEQETYKETYLHAALLMILVLLLLKELMVLITRKEKFQTKTQKNRSMYTRIFVQQFIISNVTLTLLPGKVGEFSLHDVIDNMFGIKSLNKGWSSKDMDTRFWGQIATTVAIYIFLQIFITHILSIIVGLVHLLIKNQNLGSFKLQGDLNKYIVPRRFNLASKYAFLSNIMVVSLSYCSGQPMLIPIAVIVFISTYLFDKFQLIKLCSKPKLSQQNEYLQQQVNQSLIYIALIKLVYSIWTFSSPVVYPQATDIRIQANQNPKFNQMLVLNFVAVYSNVQDVFHRLMRNPGLAIVFFLVLVVLVFQRQLQMVFDRLVGLCSKNMNRARPFSFSSTYIIGNYQQEISGLSEYTSYDLKKNPKYLQAYQLLESESMNGLRIEKVQIDKELLNLNSVENQEEIQNVELLKNGS